MVSSLISPFECTPLRNTINMQMLHNSVMSINCTICVTNNQCVIPDRSGDKYLAPGLCGPLGGRVITLNSWTPLINLSGPIIIPVSSYVVEGSQGPLRHYDLNIIATCGSPSPLFLAI